MRVRKSVLEGYKTHKTLAVQGFPFPSTAPLDSKASTRATNGGANMRELQPFCGLHKTGGWAAQELPPSSAPAAMQTAEEDEDDLPGLTMSQSTVPSSQGSFASPAPAISGASRKRTYEDEIEEEMDAFFDDPEIVESVTPNMPRTARPMAKAKAPLRKVATVGVPGVVGVDDFDDAAFLVPRDSMGMDGT